VIYILSIAKIRSGLEIMIATGVASMLEMLPMAACFVSKSRDWFPVV